MQVRLEPANKEDPMGLFTGKSVIVTGGGKATLKDGSAG